MRDISFFFFFFFFCQFWWIETFTFLKIRSHLQLPPPFVIILLPLLFYIVWNQKQWVKLAVLIENQESFCIKLNLKASRLDLKRFILRAFVAWLNFSDQSHGSGSRGASAYYRILANAGFFTQVYNPPSSPACIWLLQEVLHAHNWKQTTVLSNLQRTSKLLKNFGTPLIYLL